MRNKGLVATIVIMSGVIVTLLVILLVINMPTIISISDIKEKVIERVVEQTDATEEYHETETIKIDVPEVTTDIKTYEGYNGAVSIEYPEISGLDDLDKQAKINNKIKMNALSIVSLYPVSTALQKLNINCEIDYLDKKYITIIYSGMLVGNDVKKNTAVTYEDTYIPSYTPKVSNANDPYLNGFVDPLLNGNMAIPTPQNNNVKKNSFDINVDLPLPKETQAIGNVIGNVSGVSSSQTIDFGKNSSSTSDSGPTVSEVKMPTAKPKGGIQSSGNQIVPGETGTSNVPIQASDVIQVYPYSTSTSKITNTNQKIYFTNTIDLENNIDLTLSNYGDIETFAKYARSSDAEYVNIDSSKKAEVREYIRKTPLSTLIEDLKKSDFRNEQLTTWPKHFSYQDKDGNIYFTIKLTTKLGNYVIIKYSK